MRKKAEVAQGAVFFADVTGSTSIYEKFGDRLAQMAIQDCLTIMTSQILLCQGRVIKTIGDELMCVLPTASLALQASIKIQEAVNAATAGTRIPLQVRIGFHFGPQITQDGDVYGDSVNLAARMAAIAKASQIITTGDTIALLPDSDRAQTRPFDRSQVKGKRETVTIHEVVWQKHDLTEMVTLANQTADMPSLILRLKHGNREIALDPTSTPFEIGRAEGCGLTINHPRVSRHHALISYRRGKFILTDKSTNGTFVLPSTVAGSDQELFLRREDLPLQGGGQICLGQKCATDASQPIHFDCD